MWPVITQYDSAAEVAGVYVCVCVQDFLASKHTATDFSDEHMHFQ